MRIPSPRAFSLSRCFAYWIVVGLALALATAAPAEPHAASKQSVAGYRNRLQALAAIVENCRQQTDASHCSPDAVGPDDLVEAETQSAAQRISYEWLRDSLSIAGSRKNKGAETRALLDDAAQRILLELSEAPGGTGAPPARSTQSAHAALTTILDRAEFRDPGPSMTQRVLDAAALWINRRLAALAEYSSHRRWLGLLLEWGLAGIACLGLAYWFVRQGRRSRGLAAEHAAGADRAPGVRDWERLRRSAEEAARQQRWRDAVRDYYWAAIARLESRGLWPADRTRTPREYLRLLTSGHAKRDDLRLLTRRFETCWYGSDTAEQTDCDAARQLFERLVTR